MNEINKNETNNDIHAEKNVKRSHRLDIVALILCFVAAFSIWLFVMNTNQTVIEKKIVVTVNVAEQVKNATGLDIISEKNDVDYTQITVELTLSGTQSALEKCDEKDIAITIKDLDQIESGDKRTLVFNDPDLPGEDITFVQMSPAYISSVLIDEVTELDVLVNAEYEGGVQEGKLEPLKPGKFDPKSGIFTEFETIKVKGPKSIISAVEQVIVNVDISNYQKSTIIKSKTFEFIDVSGVQLKDNYITVDPSEVDVRIIVTYENKNVPINVLYTVDDSDKYKYEYTIAYKDGLSDVPSLALTGDSAYFKESLIYDLGNITNAESYSFELDREKLLMLVPSELSVGVDANLDRVIVITIVKTEIKPEEPESTDGSNDFTDTDSPSETSAPDIA